MERTKKTEKFRSLSFTLVVTFIAICTTALLIASGLFIYFDFTTQQQLISEQQGSIAFKASQTVDAFLQEEISILEKATALVDLGNIDQAKQKEVLERLLGKVPAFRQLVILDADGKATVRVSRLSRLLSAELINYDTSELLSGVLQKKIYISPVYVDKTTNEPMVILAVEAKDILGNFKNVLLAEVNLKFMWDLVEKIEVGENGLAYVVDKQGNLLAFSNISRVLKGENLKYLEEVRKFIEHDENPTTNTVNISQGIQNTLVVTSHVHLEGPDWAMVVELPILEAYQPVIKRVVLSVLTLIGVFGLAVTAIVYLSNRITKPIIYLTATASKIGQGTLDSQIQVETRNEIGELASAFNQMTSNLRKSREKLEEYSRGLEEQVSERTKELNLKLTELERMNKLMIGRELKMTELKEKIRELENASKSENKN